MSTSITAANGHAEPVDILLVGLGSIGSVYAYVLERSGRARVTAVARSNYELYTTSGVTLNTAKYGRIEGWKPYKVVKSQSEALASGTQYAFALVTTKCLLDVLPNAKLLAEAIESGQIEAWSLIQNGLGVEEDLYEAVKEQQTPVISSLAWIGIMTSPDGKVVNWGSGPDVLVSGLYPPAPPQNSSAPARIFSEKEKKSLDLWTDLLRAGEAIVHTTDHIDSIRFSKNVWNCTWSSVQGLVRTTALEFAPLDPEQRDSIKAFFKEVVTVGFETGLLYEGMTLYPTGEIGGTLEDLVDHAWDRVVGMAVSRGTGHKMSLLIDVELDRPFEVEVITGAVLRLAKQHKIPTPRLELIYSLLKVLQGDLIKKQKDKVKLANVGA